jgi:predicted cupin superfamily sugar epimerase
MAASQNCCPFLETQWKPEPQHVLQIIKDFDLDTNIEGGYFIETDRDDFKIPSPFVASEYATSSARKATRNASTTIFYLLSPGSPVCVFHRNKGRTIHTLHHGRGRYVIIHADEAVRNSGSKARLEVFDVGHDTANGEKLQWIVEGGKYKASFLLPDKGQCGSRGLLISETVIPGFEYEDHDFLRPESLKILVGPQQAKELSWLLRDGEST